MSKAAMIKPYAFPVPHRAARLFDTDKRPDDKPIKVVTEVPMIVQGKAVDSKPEAYVAWALEKEGIDFKYQFQAFGGRGMTGGVEVDFMLYHPLPTWTAVFVQGRYWHRESERNGDMIQMQKLMIAMRGRIQEPVELWEDWLETPEMALETIRRMIL